MTMQPPYTVRQMADRAGTGEQPAPDTAAHVCVGCGTAVTPGRLYCERDTCRRLWVSIGNPRGKRFEELPSITSYSW